MRGLCWTKRRSRVETAQSAPILGQQATELEIMKDESSKPAADDPGETEINDDGADASVEQHGEPETAGELQAALEAAREEAASLRDTALRAQAETENVRRRTARDVENAHRFALERFTADLLAVLDSLEKAVESAATAVDAAAVVEGVKLSLKLFLDTLRKHGIEQVDPLGEPFDPAQQEAMAVVVNPDAEPNSVMEVMQRGYLLNGRLVRAAKVIVSKAPEAQQATASGDGEPAPDGANA